MIHERVTEELNTKDKGIITRHVNLRKCLEGLSEGGYDEDTIVTVLEYEIYILKRPVKEGGCDILKQHNKIVEIEDNDDVLHVRSLKSSDSNCAIAMFTNTLGIKRHPNILRKDLGIPLYTYINVDQLYLLIDHFKCDIKLFIKTNTEFKIVKDTNKYDKKIRGILRR